MSAKHNEKSVFKFFDCTQWEKEEAFLRKMHKEGWALKEISFMYHFERCKPEDFVYRMDYKRVTKKNLGAYMQIFADCDWEYATETKERFYFRKPASEERPEDDEIFDDEGKLTLCRWTFFRKLLPMIFLFVLCLLPEIGENLQFTWRAVREIQSDPSTIVFLGVWWFCVGLYILIFTRFAYRYFTLRKRIRDRK